jgi:hypothetical protein
MLQFYALQIDNSLAGQLLTAELGIPGGGVASTPSTQGGGKFKEVQTVMPSASFTCGAGMSAAFYHWLKDCLDQNWVSKDVTIIVFNEKNEILRRLEIDSAVASEITFPGLNKAVKEKASIAVRITPRMARFYGGSAAALPLAVAGLRAARPWFTSDFRLSIKGLEKACSHVTAIKPFGGKATMATDLVGASREPESIPTNYTFSNIVVTLPFHDAQDFIAWHDDLVKKRDSDNEKDGSLQFLSPGTSTAYFEVEFRSLGIKELTKASGSGSTVSIDMYYEALAFAYSASATSS